MERIEGSSYGDQGVVTDISRTFAFYHPEGSTFELCGIGTDRFPKAIEGGFFDKAGKAVEAAAALTRTHHAVYVTMNAVNNALLGRAYNRVVPHLARTQDRDITRITHLLIDADPVRPSKVSATEPEHTAAIHLYTRIKEDMATAGWPEPLFGDSGNGGHLVYAVDFQNSPETVELIKSALQALAQRYDTDTIQIDQTVFNPARVSKVYGTWARKGDSTPDRPHRIARIISIPSEPQPVPLELLKALAKGANAKRTLCDATTQKSCGTFDLAGYLDDHEIAVKQVKPYQEGNLYVLDVCLFDKTHTGGEAAIGQTAGGALFYKCFHNSCRERTWHDARKMISGDLKLNGPASNNGKNSERMSQAQRLIQLTEDVSLFHTPDFSKFAVFQQNGHHEVWPIRSRGFKDWLNHRFYQDQKKPPGAQATEEALRLLEAKARYEGEENPVYLRVGEHGGNIYLDLGNSSWEVTEISPDGWRIITDPPLKFRRTRGMLPLPHPVSGGSLEELRPFLNLPSEASFRLGCGFLVRALSPTGSYPILNLEGEQGTGKSLTARIFRALVDPSTAALRTAPRNERDLMIMANNSWLLAFDNLSGVPDWLSDSLCRLSTGGGLSMRELYTDSEEILLDATRPQILTGIDRISSRHDLIDRSLIMALPVISPDMRRKEKELWHEFEDARPRILGAICDAVSTALANFETVKPDHLPRMADFAAWVIAAETSLPWEPGKFIEAYSNNQSDAITLALDADIVAYAVRLFMNDRDKWQGTPTSLLESLKEVAPEETRRLRSWPKAANSLTKRLRRAATFLRAVGIEVDLDRRLAHAGTRIATLIKTSQETVTTVSNDGQNLTSQAAAAVPVCRAADATELFADGLVGVGDDWRGV